MKPELLAIIVESCCFTQNELVKWKLEVWLCAETRHGSDCCGVSVKVD